MAIQGVQTIEGVLQQLRTTAAQAGAPAENPSVGTVDFGGMLKTSIDKVSNLQQSSRKQAQDFQLGVSDVGLSDVMIDIQKSSLALQFGLQVRNNLVAAYKDIMSTAV